jgi:hypothetical protein
MSPNCFVKLCMTLEICHAYNTSKFEFAFLFICISETLARTCNTRLETQSSYHHVCKRINPAQDNSHRSGVVVTEITIQSIWDSWSDEKDLFANNIKNIDISELFISFSSPVWTRLLYLRLLCVITKDD